MNQYPKILILGNFVNLSWGGGITLFNLFKDWPKDKICIAGDRIEKDGIEICERYYRLGNDEYIRKWPLNKFQPDNKSGIVNISLENLEKTDFKEYGIKRLNVSKNKKQLIRKILHFFGLHNYFFQLKISDNFIQWVKQENPDLIYIQPLPENIDFDIQLYKKLKIPYVIHLMDDWHKISKKPGLSRLYWNGHINNGFKYLLKNASGLMSICQSMSDEYKKRFGHDFKPFHNCIDVKFWEKDRKKTWDIRNNKFIILYAGRIGKGTSKSLITFGKAVEKCVENGLPVEFHLQSNLIPDNYLSHFKKLKHTKLLSYISYSDLPKKLASADMLLLPMDFDRKNLKFIHLSMPTKVPEYMASGTPVLVFADNSTALYKYASSGNWAFTVNRNSEKELIKSIDVIFHNLQKRERIAKNALKIVDEFHDGNKVREEFRDYLKTCC